MALVRYPMMSGVMRDFERARREMERLFGGGPSSGSQATRSGVFPPLNVSEDGQKIYVTAEIPGIQPEDLEISVVGNTLNISGERKPDNAENVAYHRRERRAGRFQKAVTLPHDINADAVTAACKNGILKLVLPKAEHAKPKKITVKTD